MNFDCQFFSKDISNFFLQLYNALFESLSTKLKYNFCLNLNNFSTNEFDNETIGRYILWIWNE